MAPNASGSVTLLVILLTWSLNALFGILIARAVYRAYRLQDTDAYLRIVLLNDGLERIRQATLNEVISWSSI